jgi:hypothetical protein
VQTDNVCVATNLITDQMRDLMGDLMGDQMRESEHAFESEC